MKDKLKETIPLQIWIIVALVVLVAGGFFAWQYFGAPKTMPVDEAVGWKTYRSEGYGFEFRYPDDWSIDKRGIDLAGEISGYIWISPSNPINSNAERFKACGLLFGFAGTDYSWDWKQKTREIMIGGRKFAQKVLENSNGYLEAISVNDVPAGDGLFLSGVGDKTCLLILNQILSTFRFLE